jgi:hypothetical protein
MGVHIIIETLASRAHPEWDGGRYAGDRDILSIIEANGGTLQHPTPEEYDPWKHGEDIHYRPADFDALARAEWPAFNEERWRLLQRILRDEADYWLRISY